MNRKPFYLLAGAAMSVISLTHAATGMPAANAPPISESEYVAIKDSADAQYKTDEAACASLGGNTKDVCMVRAKAQRSVTNADAEAAYDNTPKQREAARLARADARNAIAMEKCEDLAGNGKAVCEAEANAAFVSSKADAAVDRVTADTRLEAAEEQSQARSDAKAEKSSADYEVAVEKCGVLAGQAKDDCIGVAKIRFGKS